MAHKPILIPAGVRYPFNTADILILLSWRERIFLASSFYYYCATAQLRFTKGSLAHIKVPLLVNVRENRSDATFSFCSGAKPFSTSFAIRNRFWYVIDG